MTLQNPFPWYAIRVRSKHERMVTLSLKEKGYPIYLPLYRSRRNWHDRVKELDLPLFPGYTFSRFDAQKRLPILQTVGVVSIVGSSAGPIPVEEPEIESVRRMLNAKLPIHSEPPIRVGQPVRVVSGPLEGLEGVLVESKGRFRLVVSLSLLNRSVHAEVDREWLRPIGALSAQASN